ncbi:MAG: hypothetical protein DMG35_18560, partial [Acidobacteria bacterium]
MREPSEAARMESRASGREKLPGLVLARPAKAVGPSLLVIDRASFSRRQDFQLSATHLRRNRRGFSAAIGPMTRRNSGFNVEHAIARTAGTAREMEKSRRKKMEDFREGSEYEQEKTTAPTGVNRILIGAVVALLVIAGVAFGYGYRQQIMVSHL